jgi:dissimilatory sulfite reductase (desulfoviridin) alpha/beta subunit
MSGPTTIDRFIEDKTESLSVDLEVEGRKGALDFETLRTGGIIKQRQNGIFTVRLMCPGGRVPLSKLEKALAVARHYGGDFVHLSNRQSLEIPYVDFNNLGKVQKELAEVEQRIASCGPRVRVPTACSGCEYNPNGLTDTQGMAQLVCERFFAKKPLPHKFKISFSGCPIDCMRTNEHDLGFQGAIKPAWEEATCIACGICAQACQEGAIVSDPEGKPLFSPEKCLYCADCIRSCPSESWQAEKTGWIVRCGGKHGRHPLNGQKIAEFLPDGKVPDLIEAVINWYEEQASGAGRIRLGSLLQDTNLWRKFIHDLRPVLGEFELDNPSPPQRNEIHFFAP